ncbi:MAG: ribose-phosphate diphosphokinase [Candidatus Micrarchaeia archaeon]
MFKKLVLCSTPSGRPLAEKASRELTMLFEKEHKKLEASQESPLQQHQLNTLELVRESNLRQFGAPEFMLWPLDVKQFSSGEIKPVVKSSVRGADVFLFHHSYEPGMLPSDAARLFLAARDMQAVQEIYIKLAGERSVLENDKIAEMCIDALKKDCMASRVILISPFFSNSRQDHRRGREGLTLRTQVRLFDCCGVDAYYTVDLHSQAAIGLSERHMDNVHPTQYLVERFKKLYPDFKSKFVLVSPDAGATKRIHYIADKFIDLPIIAGDKERDYARQNAVDRVNVGGTGLARDKYALIIDDMVDTAGSISVLMRALRENEGIRGAVVMCSHALLSGPAIERLDALYSEGLLLKLIATDSVPRPSSFAEAHPWYDEISLAPVIARYIYNMYMNEPVEDVYLKDD